MVDYQKFGYAVLSDNRKAIVKTLGKGPHLPKEIAEKNNIHNSTVSRTLKDLSDEGIAKLLVDEESKKARLYGLTDKGKDVANMMQERDSDE